MKICFIASSNTIFTHSYIENFSKNKKYKDLSFIDISKEKYQDIDMSDEKITRLYQSSIKPSENSIIKRFLKKISCDRWFIVNFFLYLKEKKKLSHNTKNLIKKHILKHEPDIIIYFWSTTVRREKKYIDTIFCGKDILIINTYPVRDRVKFKVRSLFCFMDRKFFSSFSGIVVPFQSMIEHFNHNEIKIKKYMVQPDIINFNYEKKHQPQNKGLIFLGNTNFKTRSIDDVSSKLLFLCRNDISITLQSSKDIQDYNEFNSFIPFSFKDIKNGKLNNYINSFDGVILTYNEVCNARTYSGFPTRFALALQSDVPIYMEKGVYTSIENEFKGRVFPYSSTDELKRLISMPKNIKSLNYKAVEEKWDSFLTSMFLN